jgi:hypothetical protein
VRHGFPDHMVKGQTGGWTDSHLTDLAWEQARRTGSRLAQMLEGADYAFCSSDLLRARELRPARQGARACRRGGCEEGRLPTTKGLYSLTRCSGTDRDGRAAVLQPVPPRRVPKARGDVRSELEKSKLQAMALKWFRKRGCQMPQFGFGGCVKLP